MKKIVLHIVLFFLFVNVHAQKFFSAHNTAVPAVRTNALSFDGVNDYVNLGNYNAFTGNYTIEAWVYLTSNSHTNTILGKFNGSVAGSIYLSIGSDNKITAQREVPPYSLVSNNAIPDNVWTHVAMTYDGTNLNIYINGSLDISAARGSITANNEDVLIGAKKNTSTPVDFFEGSIGDVRIWNTVRTPAQLQQYMYATLSGTETGLIGYFDFNQGSVGQNNSGITTLYNKVPSTTNGTLTNFTLTDPNLSNWVFIPEIYKGPDGTSAANAAMSAYQIKKDYPNSADGIYWIKNPNINSGTPFQIYADMTTDGGGWTLILKNSTYVGWTYANTIALNNTTAPNYFPYTSNADITSTSTANYSIVGWADYIKKSTTGFQYMLEAQTRGSYGGIWTVNNNISFTSSSNASTIASGAITRNSKFGAWLEADDGTNLGPRMPWYTNAGNGYLTTDADNTGNWWGTLVTNQSGWTSAPWMGNAPGVQSPTNIWYWVR
jgi:hypothetical protein